MSEYINNVARRKETIKSVLRQLHAGKRVEDVLAEFGGLAREVSYSEITEIEQMLIDEGLPAEEIQKLCDVHVALFREGLDEARLPETIPGHPVFTFRAENEAVLGVLEQIRQSLEQAAAGDQGKLIGFPYQLEILAEYDRHFLRKEHLLFPFLEKYGFYGPSKVMWGIHNEIRASLKALREQAERASLADLPVLRQKFAELSAAIQEMTYKEEKILFPAALERLAAADWGKIHAQENELGYFLVKPGTEWQPSDVSADTPATAAADSPAVGTAGGLIALDTGALTAEQVNLMLVNLPVDITFVDENDEVRYFSQTRERIFDRTPAIIGRKVQNCHPPQSLARVQRILDDFRAGKRSAAEFWINFGGRMVHIRYFALRNASGGYRGTLEVTQEISAIRALQGEKRLENDERIG